MDLVYLAKCIMHYYVLTIYMSVATILSTPVCFIKSTQQVIVKGGGVVDCIIMRGVSNEAASFTFIKVPTENF